MESGTVVAGDDPAGLTGDKTFADALGGVGDGGQAVGLGLDEKIGQRFAGGGVDGDVGRGVKRRGIAQKTEKTYALGQPELGGELFTRGAGGTFAGLRRGG